MPLPSRRLLRRRIMTVFAVSLLLPLSSVIPANAIGMFSAPLGNWSSPKTPLGPHIAKELMGSTEITFGDTIAIPAGVTDVNGNFLRNGVIEIVEGGAIIASADLSQLGNAGTHISFNFTPSVGTHFYYARYDGVLSPAVSVWVKPKLSTEYGISISLTRPTNALVEPCLPTGELDPVYTWCSQHITEGQDLALQVNAFDLHLKPLPTGSRVTITDNGVDTWSFSIDNPLAVGIEKPIVVTGLLPGRHMLEAHFSAPGTDWQVLSGGPFLIDVHAKPIVPPTTQPPVVITPPTTQPPVVTPPVVTPPVTQPPVVTPPTPQPPAPEVLGEQVEARDSGYRLVAADGGVFDFNKPSLGSLGGTKLNGSIIASIGTPTGEGYWLIGSDGGVFSFGDARFFGSTGDKKLNAPIIGAASTPKGDGYWLIAADGGVFSFGNAQFHGSTGGQALNAPIIAATATPSGNGYWLLASDGGVFSFGDAKFHGSTGDRKLNKPIVGIAASPTGDGYWLVASDGGVFAFGDAKFHGSAGASKLNQPIVAMRATTSGNGYWFVAADGGVFAFGDARYFGSTGAIKLNEKIIGLG